MYYVYKTTNLINSIIYVGLRVHENPCCDKYLGSGKIFKLALKKYGRKNFTREILGFAKSKDELNNLEVFYIKKYDATNPEIGYNILQGGNLSALGIDKVKVFQYDLDGNFIEEFPSIKKASLKTNISESNIAHCSKNNKTAFNTQWFREYKGEKINPYENSKWKKVNKYDLFGKFIKNYKSLVEATEDTGLVTQSITACINGKMSRAGDYIWKFDEGDYNDILPFKQMISQYDKDMNFIRTWNSTIEAAKTLNLKPSAIHRILKGIRKHTGGFHFKRTYKDETKTISE